MIAFVKFFDGVRVNGLEIRRFDCVKILLDVRVERVLVRLYML